MSLSSDKLEALQALPALAPPEGVTPNFDNPPNQNGLAWAVTTTCMVIATLCLFVRCYARLWIEKKVRIEEGIVPLSSFYAVKTWILANTVRRVVLMILAYVSIGDNLSWKRTLTSTMNTYADGQHLTGSVLGHRVRRLRYDLDTRLLCTHMESSEQRSHSTSICELSVSVVCIAPLIRES